MLPAVPTIHALVALQPHRFSSVSVAAIDGRAGSPSVREVHAAPSQWTS